MWFEDKWVLGAFAAGFLLIFIDRITTAIFLLIYGFVNPCLMGGRHDWEVLDIVSEEATRRGIGLPQRYGLMGDKVGRIEYNRVCWKCKRVENDGQLLTRELEAEKEERRKAHDIFIEATKNR